MYNDLYTPTCMVHPIPQLWEFNTVTPNIFSTQPTQPGPGLAMLLFGADVEVCLTSRIYLYNAFQECIIIVSTFHHFTVFNNSTL